MKDKLLFTSAGFLAGLLAGAFGLYAWLAWAPGGAGTRAVYEASIFSAGPIEVWYQSVRENGNFENEFRFRKLCGDARIPCAEWKLGGVTKSERAYPSKDIEFHVVGEKVLMSFPDGHTIKGSLSETWTVEAP